MSRRFWVIGGEYMTVKFDRMVDGTERVFGPYVERSEAERMWRTESERHRSECCVRFSIVEEKALAAVG
jgi:hypothetical protein